MQITYIHQKIKTNIINEEWKKTKNDVPFAAFYDMHAVMFVLPDEMVDVSIVGLQWFILIPRLHHTGSHRPSDEMADVSITGLQWFILIPQLNHTGSHGPSDSSSKLYLHREKKYKIWNKKHQPTAILQIKRKAVVHLSGVIILWNFCRGSLD